MDQALFEMQKFEPDLIKMGQHITEAYKGKQSGLINPTSATSPELMFVAVTDPTHAVLLIELAYMRTLINQSALAYLETARQRTEFGALPGMERNFIEDIFQAGWYAACAMRSMCKQIPMSIQYVPARTYSQYITATLNAMRALTIGVPTDSFTGFFVSMPGILDSLDEHAVDHHHIIPRATALLRHALDTITTRGYSFPAVTPNAVRITEPDSRWALPDIMEEDVSNTPGGFCAANH